jgi:hypothetical protein
MDYRMKFAVAVMSAAASLAIGLLAARDSVAVSADRPEGEIAPDSELLIAHALGAAIDGTTAHLTARSIATLSDRDKGKAKGALEAMRTSARSAYQDSGKLFTEAQKHLINSGNSGASRQLYDAAIAYTKTLWQLTGEATPTDEEKNATKPTGEVAPTTSPPWSRSIKPSD